MLERDIFSSDRYVQDERYFAIEHKDVRREAYREPHMCLACPGKKISHSSVYPGRLLVGEKNEINHSFGIVHCPAYSMWRFRVAG